ncbi:MAG: ferredoxin, partial [Pyrinomonadaceae bacterium]|nr:ferredoxin [Pyrinomonadaceae bacterium]
MQEKLQAQLAFHLTGTISGGGLRPLTGGMIPALFARTLDLTELRYDMPLVLNTVGTPERSVLSLSHMIDEAVSKFADASEHDRLARHGYRIEREIRRTLHANNEADLCELWNKAAVSISETDDNLLLDSARILESEFFAAGTLVDIGRETPASVVLHLWKASHRQRSLSFQQRIERLLHELHNILEAEAIGSEFGRSPDRLRASVGSTFNSAFNFEALSTILNAAKPETAISERRRERIRSLIEVLEKQRFYPKSNHISEAFEFSFERPSDALKAYNERYPAAVELVKTLAIAELEAEGAYRESRHDPIFEFFGSNGLSPGDLGQLPSYLICTDAGSLDPIETANIFEILAVGMPFKIFVRTDDVLEPSELAEGHLSLGLRARQLVYTAIGLTDVYVFQTAASSIYKCRSKLLDAISYTGPALISIFSGDTKFNNDVPKYLFASAATESRVFPTLAFDPDGGNDWASRLTIESNPQPGIDWPVYSVKCEDASIQAIQYDSEFTAVDLMAMDSRFSSHFAIVPPEQCTDDMITVTEALDADRSAANDKVPYIELVDGEGFLHKAILDVRVINEARRCRSIWRSLQELGGYNNSHAERLLALERAQISAPEEIAVLSQPANEIPAAEDRPAPEAKSAAAGDGAPYIESARCTSCNECTHINAKMFAYDENKQAYIADPSAGTFRQLVEAAEGCQVSIIHPGVPRNPKEPGIEELIARAAAF